MKGVGTMFVHDLTHVELPLETVRRLVTGDGADALVTRAAHAAAESDALCRIVVSAPGPAFDADAVVGTVEPTFEDGAVVVPLTWPAAAPLLSADLVMESLGPRRTQLTLVGRCAEAGRAGPLQRRVEQATVRAFLLRLVDGLEQAAAPAQGMGAGTRYTACS
jgi:hypothetical protein